MEVNPRARELQRQTEGGLPGASGFQANGSRVLGRGGCGFSEVSVTLRRTCRDRTRMTVSERTFEQRVCVGRRMREMANVMRRAPCGHSEVTTLPL